MTHLQTRASLSRTSREHFIEMVVVRNKIIQRLQKELSELKK